MRKHTKVLLITSALVTSAAAAPVLLAGDNRDHGMMGRGGMMSRDGMMGMMGSMMQMMDHCGRMMREAPDGSRRPNDQWRKSPSAPGEKS